MIGNRSNRFSFFAITCGLVVGSFSCGIIGDEGLEKYDKVHNGALSSQKNEASASLDTMDGGIVPFACKEKTKDLAFANKVTQTLFNRSVTEKERALAAAGKLNREKFVKEAVESPEASNGINRFIQNLFRVENIAPIAAMNNDNLAEALADRDLVADLKKEPIELVLRNYKERPWPWFFTTDEVPCTKKTAEIYEYPELESSSFVNGCKLPQNRRGFLGLASTLRAVPSTFASTNNNYARVAFAVYLTQGFRLFDATNGPTGEKGLGIPLADCVPTTDFRVDRNGLVYGTASVPAVGATCASCHSKYNAPLSIAFRHFDEFGRTYTFDGLDRIRNDLNAINTSVEMAKVLLNESQSCWSVDGISPPRKFNGIPGLARLIGDNPDMLGDALGVQLAQNLGNENPNPNISSTVKKYYMEGDQMLQSAIAGYLISESFQCAVPAKEE